jgi:Peptidase inhibitor I78 family
MSIWMSSISECSTEEERPEKPRWTAAWAGRISPLWSKRRCKQAVVNPDLDPDRRHARRIVRFVEDVSQFLPWNRPWRRGIDFATHDCRRSATPERSRIMRARRFVITVVLVAGCLGSACSGRTDRATTPTAGGPEASGSNRTPPTGQPPSPPTSGTCDPAGAKWAIGERASNDLLERARVAAKAGLARFLRPNERITMEYSSARLNLGLDEQDVVRAVTCG